MTARAPRRPAAGAELRLASRAPRWPLSFVAAAVVWNLVFLRAQLLAVPYADDNSMHEQMVRFATAQLSAGRLPLTSWFPYLGLGSPQFLHYQSLPAMIAGLGGLVIGPDAAFRWSLYLLLSLWPVSVYASARLFGTSRLAAGACAAMAPFLVSTAAIGYEQHAYIWSGFGVWTQLWASMTLPLAWGLSWRAVRDGRGFAAAVAMVALTAALHFETGYLAFIPLLLWPFVARGPARVRFIRAAVLLCGSLLASAWVTVPLLAQREWAAINEILRATPLANGYGAGKVLGWLISGQLLDFSRLPVITVLAAVGIGIAATRWRDDQNARALLAVFTVCLLLSFGRTTFGVLVDVIPGAGDIFFRRFMMGVQLAALLLAGVGAEACARAIAHELLASAWRQGGARLAAAISRPAAAVLAGWITVVLVLSPAWLQLGARDRANANGIATQRRADATHGAEVNRLVAIVQRRGGGRVYAGMPSNWGSVFTVGFVPVFKYLESRDVDEVGYTLRTASLMTDPEYHFDESNPADYVLFAIHYLILPLGQRPPVPAQQVARAGGYVLWSTEVSGYLHPGRIVGAITVDRGDVGARSIAVLHSQLALADDYLRVDFGGAQRPIPQLPPVLPRPAPGTVLSEHDDLPDGTARATVQMREPGVMVLSASFDPGWTATVDGRRQPTLMVSPALVATRVGAGVHKVSFTYRGFGYYPELWAIGALCLLALLAADVKLARRRRQGCPPTA